MPWINRRPGARDGKGGIQTVGGWASGGRRVLQVLADCPLANELNWLGYEAVAVPQSVPLLREFDGAEEVANDATLTKRKNAPSPGA